MSSPYFRLYEPVLNQSLFGMLPNELLDKIWSFKEYYEIREKFGECMERIRDKPYSEDAVREYLLDGLSGTNSSEEFLDIWDHLWLANHRAPIDCTLWYIQSFDLTIGESVICSIGRCDYVEDDGRTYTVYFDMPYRHYQGRLIAPWKKFFKRNK